MKTERRHELQTNELADWLGRGVQIMENNARTVVGALVALAIILAAYFYLSSSSEGRNTEGWNIYYQARRENDVTRLDVITQDYAGTSVAAWAQLALADDGLIAGTNDLFVDKAVATDRLRAAAEGYEEVVNSKPAARESLLKQRAMWGLARTRESLNELDQARELYGQLAEAKNWTPPLYSQDAAQRLKALEQNSTKQFYDWFAQYTPTPPASSGLGTEKLNLEALPDSPPGTQPPTDGAAAPGTETAPAAEAPATETPAAEAPAAEAPAAEAPAAEAPAAEAPAAEAGATEPPAASAEAPAAPAEGTESPAPQP